MESREFLPEDEAAMIALGTRLAAAGGEGGIVYLEGDLGAGKTTLVRAWLQALGHGGRVKSPTYTLIEPYRIGERPVYHLDLYRLGDPEELEYLGLRDYLEPGALFLIEWPEKGAGWLPPADLRIVIKHRERGRAVRIEAWTAGGEKVLELLRLHTGTPPDDP